MNKRKKITIKTPQKKRTITAAKDREAESSLSAHSPFGQILHLQKTVGNRAVRRLLRSHDRQTKRNADHVVHNTSVKTNPQTTENAANGIAFQRAPDKKGDKAALIVGQVVDDKGQPVPDISVGITKVYTSYKNVEYEVYVGESKTDENGLFKLSFLYSVDQTADLFDGSVKLDIGGESKVLKLQPALDIMNIFKALGIPMEFLPGLLKLLGGKNPVPFWSPHFYGFVALGKITLKSQKERR